MPQFKARIGRKVTTMDIVEIKISAATPEIAALKAKAEAMEYNHSCPEDYDTSAPHCAEWHTMGSMELIDDASL